MKDTVIMAVANKAFHNARFFPLEICAKAFYNEYVV